MLYAAIARNPHPATRDYLGRIRGVKPSAVS